MTRKEVLKKVIELAIENIEQCKEVWFWNNNNVFVGIFREDYYIKEVEEIGWELPYKRQKYVSTERRVLTISDKKRTVYGHLNLLHAVKSIIDYDRFAEYLVRTINEGGKKKDIIIKGIVTPLFDFMECPIGANASEKVFSAIIGCTDCIKDSEKRSDVEKLIDEGKAEEVVRLLKKELDEPKTLEKWVEIFKESDDKILKIECDCETLYLHKVELLGKEEVLVQNAVEGIITNLVEMTSRTYIKA